MMSLENELLLEAEVLINSKAEEIAQVESELSLVPGGCSGCGYGSC
ncbi:MAG: hypothetical protein LBP98_02115 [Tannerella sp.]|jgi:hypothetical protein|nr:hypothetical protein [Tannerella sp.]